MEAKEQSCTEPNRRPIGIIAWQAIIILTKSKTRHYLIKVNETVTILRDCEIQPTPQRIAVVELMLKAKSHPTADQVLEQVRLQCPTVSRATIYNTLNLLVDKGLLKTQILREGTIVFDSNVKQHHHFIDEETGDIYDIPWNALKVTGQKSLKGFQIREFQVILRGKRKRK
jgi:Fur family iron response transcriptional regulator